MAKVAKTGKKQKKAETNGTPTLPMPALATERLDIGTLETWL